MMKKTILIIYSLFLAYTLQAQKVYTFGEGTTCTVKGTSTIHDWTAKAAEVSGSMEMNKSFTKKALPKVGATIDKGEFSVAVKSLDGGRGSTMNDKIYPAFKYEQYPNITFKLTSAKVNSVDKANKTFSLNVSGQLSMAGSTQEITFPMTGQKNDTGAYIFDGQKSIDMITFNIEPPSAMFGQIETGKDVTVIFHLVAQQ